jgi:hypothetical protein
VVFCIMCTMYENSAMSSTDTLDYSILGYCEIGQKVEEMNNITPDCI